MSAALPESEPAPSSENQAAKAKAAEERFRLLVESVKDYAIFILSPTGHVSTWNSGAERIKGYRASEIIGKHFSIFYPPEQASTGKCAFELEVAARDGRFEEEGWRVRKDGSQFWANVTITALRNPDGELVGFAKVTQDLTKRREAEESLRALAAQKAALAEKARIQEFQERFLTILGHDLRNPLASIDMGAGILRELTREPAALRVLERMSSSSRRMSRMIAQILDLTRSRLAGGLLIEVKPMDLREAVTAIVQELRISHPSCVIELRCPTVPLFGLWDGNRLEQVFSNLIGNALAYGDTSKPVSVVAHADGTQVNIDVHNEGPPIPPDVLRNLFDPYRRGERDSRATETSGLGLGLYISREVVSAHAGTIDVQSSAAQGTTFRVSLPVRSAPALT